MRMNLLEAFRSLPNLIAEKQRLKIVINFWIKDWDYLVWEVPSPLYRPYRLTGADVSKDLKRNTLRNYLHS